MKILEKFGDVTRSGDYLFATDGCATVIRKFDKKTKNIPEMDSRMKSKIQSLGPNLPDEVFDAPISLKYLPDECPACAVSKEKVCIECHGSGDHYWETAYSVYQVDCKLCNGTGRITRSPDECEHCDYTGYIGRVYVSISGLSICFQSIILMKILRHIPNVRFFTRGYGKSVAFKNEEYEGFVMPYRA